MKLICLLFSIVATLSLADHTGSWEYITQAPDQDYKGTLDITKEGDVYKAKLNSSDGFSADCRDLKIEGDDISFNFDLQGYRVNISGKFAGDKLDAKVSVEGMELTMKAERKK